MSEVKIVHSSALPWETWDSTQIGSRGRVYWKTLFSRGLTDTDSLTLGIATVHPNDALLPHHHAPSEIYFLIEGEAIVTLGNEERAVRAGDAVFIPGDTRHGIANKSPSDLVFLYAFSTESFDAVVYHFCE